MVIYTGGCFGQKFEQVKSRNLGVMVSASYDTTLIKPYWKDVPCALDNGAYSDYAKGNDLPFDEHRFLQTLSECSRHRLRLDFIVLPDRVGMGKDSLNFSMRWLERLTWGRFALALQDGITEGDVPLRDEITTLFVGGTKKWKWDTAKAWIDFAHRHGKSCHIARCGGLNELRKAKEIGADSVDSSSFARNGSWHILDEFEKPKQLSL